MQDLAVHFERVISTPRLASYHPQPHDDEQCLSRCLWNTALCESFYPLLHALEISFRNAMNDALCSHYQSQDWLRQRHSELDQKDHGEVVAAEGRAQRKAMRRGRTVTHTDILTELSLGFWVELVDKKYDRAHQARVPLKPLWFDLWNHGFPNWKGPPRRRAELHGRMLRVRDLRNRIFHHEPIWRWPDLPKLYDEFQETLTLFSPAAAQVFTVADRFPLVHRRGVQQFRPLVAKQLSGTRSSR